MTAAAIASPELFIMALAKYMFAQADGFHLLDYRPLGEKYAQFLFKYLWEHLQAYKQGRSANPLAWAPFRLTGGSRNGSNLTIFHNVPSGAIVVDTTTIPAVHQSGRFSMWALGNGYELWDTELQVVSVSNTSPIVVGLNGPHGLSNGATYAFEGILGCTAANDVWTVTVQDSTHLVLTGSVGNGAYTGGGIGFAPIPITSFSISGTSVLLGMGRTPNSAQFDVAYAEHCDAAYNGGGGQNPPRRGNLRDSDPFLGRSFLSSQPPAAALFKNWNCGGILTLS
jgi:hypothetical protein